MAKASHEELLADYQAFLRQRELPEWAKDAPATRSVRSARPRDMAALRDLMARLVATLSPPGRPSPDGRPRSPTAARRRTSPTGPTSPTESHRPIHSRLLAEVAANTMICLVNQETWLLARQIARLAADFEREGGFTERLYRVRTASRSCPASGRSDKSDNESPATHPF